MQIIGGQKKGLKLNLYASKTTRPTLGRTRKDVLNILENGKFKGRLKYAVVADVFAGSGGVGLEMMSRGASRCTFFENNLNALKILKINIEKIKMENLHIEKNALKPKQKQMFDIAFFDAPYNMGLSYKAFFAFVKNKNLKPTSLVILQVGADEQPPQVKPFLVQDIRKMGGGKIIFYTTAILNMV